MNNPFKDIFSNIKVFNKSSSNSALGIDIGSSSIKVVEIKRKDGKAMLETYGIIGLGPYADLDIGRVTNLPVEKVIEALNETLKQSGVTTNSGGLAMPVQSSLIFTIELPANVKKSEMASIISTEARRYIPVPITEVSLDWFLLPKKETSFLEANSQEVSNSSLEKNEVLVVAIQNDAISKYRTIVDGCKLDAGFFEIEVFSSIRSNFEHELSLVLLIDFGASRTKLSIVEFGTIKGFHIISRGGADITDSISKSLSVPFSEAEKMKKEYGLYGNPNEKNLTDIVKTHTDYIFSETNNVLLGYEKKYNRTISKVILTGGGSLLKGLKEVAENNFKAEVEVGRPFSKVGAPAFLDKVLESTGPEFAVAIGLALRKLQ
jgi:type IV pilus assembly protein PilM